MDVATQTSKVQKVRLSRAEAEANRFGPGRTR